MILNNYDAIHEEVCNSFYTISLKKIYDCNCLLTNQYLPSYKR